VARQVGLQGGRERQLKIAPELIGLDPRDQEAIDALMIDLDGTPEQGEARAPTRSSASSMAVAKAAAEASGLRSTATSAGPGAKHAAVPMMNILNGGKHADNNVDFQEFMIQPWGFDNFSEGHARRRRDLPRAEEGPAQEQDEHRRSATRRASRRT
jgi:enolase